MHRFCRVRRSGARGSGTLARAPPLRESGVRMRRRPYPRPQPEGRIPRPEGGRHPREEVTVQPWPLWPSVIALVAAVGIAVATTVAVLAVLNVTKVFRARFRRVPKVTDHVRLSNSYRFRNALASSAKVMLYWI